MQGLNIGGYVHIANTNGKPHQTVEVLAFVQDVNQKSSTNDS